MRPQREARFGGPLITDALLDDERFLLTVAPLRLREALVQEALTVRSERDHVRVALTHALAHPRPTFAQRAAALCVALRRQGADGLAGRVERSAAELGASLPYTLICGQPLPPALAFVGEVRASGIAAAAVIEHDGEPLVIGSGSYDDGGLFSWRLDGRPGPLQRPAAPASLALAVVRPPGGEPVIVSGAVDGSLRGWRLDGEPTALRRLEAHAGEVRALIVVEDDGEALLVTGGRDGAVRSWWLDGRPGPLAVPDAHDTVDALASVRYGDRHLVVGGGDDGALRSWWLDGAAGPLQRRTDADGFEALAVAEHGGRPILVCATGDGALRSWKLGGVPGPLQVPEASALGTVSQLVVVRHGGEPLIVCADLYGALRSWRLDGTPGALQLARAQLSTWSLAVLERPTGPVIVTTGADGELSAWPVDPGIGPQPIRTDFDDIEWLASADDGEPMVIAGEHDGAVRTIRLDGRPGPLHEPLAHPGGVTALIVVRHEGEPLIVSAGGGVPLRSRRADGRPGPLAPSADHPRAVAALIAVELEGRTLLVSAGGDESFHDGVHAIRGWWLDGQPGPLQVVDPGIAGLSALVAVALDDQPLIVMADDDGALRSWWLDGRAGPLRSEGASAVGFQQLAAAAADDGGPLVVSGDTRGALRMWRPDGQAAVLELPGAVDGMFTAIATVRLGGRSLIVGADSRGVISSWWPDGQPGPLERSLVQPGGITALTVVSHENAPAVVSVGLDRTLVLHPIRRFVGRS